jgi:hydrogenase maturation protease
VLASRSAMGGELPTTYVVGCRPADVGEGIGLSGPVNDAVPRAIATVRRVVDHIMAAADTRHEQKVV